MLDLAVCLLMNSSLLVWVETAVIEDTNQTWSTFVFGTFAKSQLKAT